MAICNNSIAQMLQCSEVPDAEILGVANVGGSIG